jgi:hypothetical protein
VVWNLCGDYSLYSPHECTSHPVWIRNALRSDRYPAAISIIGWYQHVSWATVIQAPIGVKILSFGLRATVCSMHAAELATYARLPVVLRYRSDAGAVFAAGN